MNYEVLTKEELVKRVKALEQEIECNLVRMGRYAIRCHEDLGEENLCASLALSVSKLMNHIKE